MRAGERGRDAVWCIEVAVRDFGTTRGQRTRCRRIGFSGQRAQCELSLRIGKNGLGEAAALRAGGADDGNDGTCIHLAFLL